MILASGIGRMLAKGFTINGAKVILLDINMEALLCTKQELEELSPPVLEATPYTVVYFSPDRA